MMQQNAIRSHILHLVIKQLSFKNSEASHVRVNRMTNDGKPASTEETGARYTRIIALFVGRNRERPIHVCWSRYLLSNIEWP